MKTDSELQRDVLDELKWEPSVDAAHIGVSAKDGVVTLSGHVSRTRCACAYSISRLRPGYRTRPGISSLSVVTSSIRS